MAAASVARVVVAVAVEVATAPAVAVVAAAPNSAILLGEPPSLHRIKADGGATQRMCVYLFVCHPRTRLLFNGVVASDGRHRSPFRC